MITSEMTEVALFPIPQCTTFPGTVFPLHVFEPRYRQMVKECVAANRLLGICHTEAMLKPASTNQTIEEALSSNQATYQPYQIFSAGKVIIEETLPDGRILINVQLQDRYRTVKLIQSEPYSIYSCEIFKDRSLTEAEEILAEDLQLMLIEKLKQVTAENAQLTMQLRMDHWSLMSPSDFSFQLFGILRTEGDILQQILQCRSPVERLNIAKQLLSSV